VEQSRNQWRGTDQVTRRHSYRIVSLRLSRTHVRSKKVSPTHTTERATRRSNVSVEVVDRQDLKMNFLRVLCSLPVVVALRGAHWCHRKRTKHRYDSYNNDHPPLSHVKISHQFVLACFP
jgi:hypothetical protein